SHLNFCKTDSQNVRQDRDTKLNVSAGPYGKDVSESLSKLSNHS
ncbi:hypothetical protein PROFUN_17032, partial [Planoprotostelium fungivorum]